MQIKELEEGLLEIYRNIYDSSQVQQRLKHIKILAKNRKETLKKLDKQGDLK